MARNKEIKRTGIPSGSLLSEREREAVAGAHQILGRIKNGQSYRDILNEQWTPLTYQEPSVSNESTTEMSETVRLWANELTGLEIVKAVQSSHSEDGEDDLQVELTDGRIVFVKFLFQKEFGKYLRAFNAKHHIFPEGTNRQLLDQRLILIKVDDASKTISEIFQHFATRMV